MIFFIDQAYQLIFLEVSTCKKHEKQLQNTKTKLCIIIDYFIASKPMYSQLELSESTNLRSQQHFWASRFLNSHLSVWPTCCKTLKNSANFDQKINACTPQTKGKSPRPHRSSSVIFIVKACVLTGCKLEGGKQKHGIHF